MNDKRKQFRFSLLTLLILTTAIAVAFGIWRSTRRYSVSALLHINPDFSTVSMTPSSLTEFQEGQIALLTSSEFLTQVFESSSVARLNTIGNRTKAIQQFQERLSVRFFGETLQLKTEGRGQKFNFDKAVLNQLILVYRKAFEEYSNSKRNENIAEMSATVKKNAEKLDQKSARLEKLVEGNSADTTEILLLRDELQVHQNEFDSLRSRIQELKASEFESSRLRILQQPYGQHN